MHGFDIALVVVGGGRNAQMLAVAERRGEAGAAPLPIVAADKPTRLPSLT
jgi:hypothetical protein